MTDQENFIKETLQGFIRKHGELVSKEEESFRENQCKGCEFNGIVEPLPNVKMEGCTKCKCPFGTKRKMKWIYRLKDSQEELSLSEIIKIKLYKSFDKDRIEKKVIKCPHPEGDKWAKQN